MLNSFITAPQSGQLRLDDTKNVGGLLLIRMGCLPVGILQPENCDSWLAGDAGLKLLKPAANDLL